MREARISSQQLAHLVFVFNLMASLLILPAPMAKTAGPDAWLAAFLGVTVGSLPVSLLLGLLARRHPHLGFGEVAELCLGKWLGRLAVLITGLFGFAIASLIFRNVMDFAVIALLPGTPSLVIAALFAVAVSYAACAGSEVNTRLAVLVSLLAALAFGVVAAGTLPEQQFNRMLPVLGNGPAPVLAATWPSAGWAAEFLVLAPFVFQVSRPAKALRALVLGNLAAALFLSTLVALTTTVFSAKLAQKFTYPVYEVAREVALGQFLERVEIALITVWISGMLVKAAVSLWAGTRCITWSVGLPNVRWAPIVTAAGALWLTQIWKSELEQAWFSTVYWTPLTLPIFFGLPLLMLLGSFWRMRQRKGVSL